MRSPKSSIVMFRLWVPPNIWLNDEVTERVPCTEWLEETLSNLAAEWLSVGDEVSSACIPPSRWCVGDSNPASPLPAQDSKSGRCRRECRLPPAQCSKTMMYGRS
mmetsp:Transcript_45520/g.134760  ORF Transcript_45520/g.134760 Transcript_45520/m.134760 type:complete len:105 (+) Transcript_45520:709-1023(+)